MTREEAIKRLSDIRADYSCFDDDERLKYHALSMAIEALQDDWIPVSDDTLPKDARPVLVYAWNVHHVVGQYKNMRTDDGKYEDMWVTASAYEAPHKIEKVIAWKPLTIPFKESDSE